MANHKVKHTHHWATLAVTYGVKHLIDFLCSLDCHRDGVTGLESVECHCAQHHVRDEWLVTVVLGVQCCGCQCLCEGCEWLVEPQVVPPLHGDKVAKPLVCEFVVDDRRHSVFLSHTCCCFVNEQVCLTLSDQPPVFHGTCFKVTNSNTIQFRQGLIHLEPFFVQFQTCYCVF